MYNSALSYLPCLHVIVDEVYKNDNDEALRGLRKLFAHCKFSNTIGAMRNNDLASVRLRIFLLFSSWWFLLCHLRQKQPLTEALNYDPIDGTLISSTQKRYV